MNNWADKSANEGMDFTQPYLEDLDIEDSLEEKFNTAVGVLSGPRRIRVINFPCDETKVQALIDEHKLNCRKELSNNNVILIFANRDDCLKCSCLIGHPHEGKNLDLTVEKTEKIVRTQTKRNTGDFRRQGVGSASRFQRNDKLQDIRQDIRSQRIRYSCPVTGSIRDPTKDPNTHAHLQYTPQSNLNTGGGTSSGAWGGSNSQQNQQRSAPNFRGGETPKKNDNPINTRRYPNRNQPVKSNNNFSRSNNETTPGSWRKNRTDAARRPNMRDNRRMDDDRRGGRGERRNNDDRRNDDRSETIGNWRRDSGRNNNNRSTFERTKRTKKPLGSDGFATRSKTNRTFVNKAQDDEHPKHPKNVNRLADFIDD